jgi:hypothetical protein
MKAYLITTGILFGLLGLAHFARTVLEWERLTTDRGFLLEGPGIGLVGAGLSVWAWRLLWTRRAVRAAGDPG